MSADHLALGSATSPVLERPQPALSWSAIWAGAFVAVAAGLVLSSAAVGIGYDTGFPGLATRSSLRAFAPGIGAGAVLIQVLSAGLGGYVAGRTRTIWTALHDDESHFRDTAHGLITWAVATVGGLVLAATVVAPYVGALAATATPVLPSPALAQRAAAISAQASLFMAVGMLLSAFVSAVAARIGGLRHEEMHARRLG